MTLIPIYSFTVPESYAASSATFSNIPQTFNHLQLRVVTRGKDPTFSYMNFAFNGDVGTSSNYHVHGVTSNGSSTGNINGNNIGGISDFYVPGVGQTLNVHSICIADILDYKNTNKFKTLKAIFGWDGSGTGFALSHSGLWKNTAAITSVTTFNITFEAGSRLELYGAM
jgi:hypothetical protein